MKHTLPAAAAFLFMMACTSSAQSPMVEKQAQQGFAVVELFTSEGCSSCPPADKVLAQLAEEYRDQPVLLIEEHVDYWDRLGWKDPFSNKEFTQRQYAYAAHFGTDGVYTPQAVINGSMQINGSQKTGIKAAISAALALPPAGSIILKKEESTAGGLTISYKAAGLKGARVLIMQVQRKAVIKVGNGENGGRTLAHTNVVRAIRESNEPGGTFAFSDAGLSSGEYFMTGIIQAADGSITGMAILKN